MYKNKKYYIENDINNLEIPAIVSDNPKEKEIKIIRNLENNNNKNKKKQKKENLYQEKNNEEIDIENQNNSLKNSKIRENNILSEKHINSLENKTQQMINNNNNNFNSNTIKNK